MSTKVCSVEGCERPAFCRGMCKTDYMHWWRHNADPNSTPRMRYSDQEMSVIDDRSITAAEAAKELGLHRQTVAHIRRRIDLGIMRVSDWTTIEVDFVLENRETMTAKQLAAFLGRTVHQVETEIQRLINAGAVTRRSSQSMNPCVVAGRRLLAKTCPKCGEMLDAKWFHRKNGKAKGGAATYETECRKCDSERAGASMRTRREANDRYQKRLQEVTLENAENHGKEWTHADLEILADKNKTVFQKAMELKRTFIATRHALAKNGLTSTPDWKQMKNGEWNLFWEFDFDAEDVAA